MCSSAAWQLAVHLLLATAACASAGAVPFSVLRWSGAGSATSSVPTSDTNVVPINLASTNQVGALWYRTPLPLSVPFSVSFEFLFTSCTTVPADGGCFAMQTSGVTAITSGGVYLGISGLPNWAAVCFDLYSGEVTNMFSTGGYVNEPQVSMPQKAELEIDPAYVTLGSVPITVMYDPSTEALTWEIEGNGITVPHSYHAFGGLETLLSNNTAYFGFTAATGGSYCRTDVRNVFFNFECPAPDVTGTGASLTQTMVANEFSVGCGAGMQAVNGIVHTHNTNCTLIEQVACVPMSMSPSPSMMPSMSSTKSSTPSNSPSRTASASPSVSASPTPTPTRSASSSQSAIPSQTATPTSSASGTVTSSASGTATSSASSTVTSSASGTATSSASASASGSSSSSQSASITASVSASATTSATASVTTSASTSCTPSSSNTGSSSPSLSGTASTSAAASAVGSPSSSQQGSPASPTTIAEASAAGVYRIQLLIRT